MARVVFLSGVTGMVAMLAALGVMRLRAMIGARDPVLRWAAGWTALLVAAAFGHEALLWSLGAAGTVTVAALQR